MSVLEREIEQRLRLAVARRGGLCLKWVCPGWSGVPDRIVLLPGARIVFVELKRPKGGRYSALQDKWQEWLTALGFPYWRIKNAEELQSFLAEIEEEA